VAMALEVAAAQQKMVQHRHQQDKVVKVEME
jgi:hypothetical protein